MSRDLLNPRSTEPLLHAAATGSPEHGCLRFPLWPCLTLCVAGLSVIPWDAPISHWATSIKLGGDVRRELEVAQQFGGLLSITVVFTLIWLLDSARRRIIWSGVGSLACTGMFCTAAKLLFGRPRPKFNEPSLLGPWGTFDLGGKTGVRHAWEFWAGISSDLWSMPSSHTAFAAALAVFLAAAYPRLRGPVALSVAVVAIARVLLGAHYPSDVLVGAAIGWSAGVLGMMTVNRFLSERMRGMMDM